MKIAVGCDHGGLEHKNAIAEHLKSEGFEVEDFGIYENKSVDYPEIALKVANSIKTVKTSWEYWFAEPESECRLRQNKVNGIRAAACSEHFSAKIYPSSQQFQYFMPRRQSNRNRHCA